ncbi:MAG: flagellar biosynthesis protein FlhB [Opitutaceae bacterium]|nr:flagellar biosynthesis protein FlhB [Opitutaceae bacterium]
MAENNFEKTEAPTPRRLQEARNDGNIARSTDLTAAIMLLGGIVALHMLGTRMFEGLGAATRVLLMAEHSPNPTRVEGVGEMAYYSAYMFATSLGPVVIAVAAVGLLSSLGQVGFLLTVKPLEPNFGKLSPLKGIANLFKLRAVMRLVMSVQKVVLIAAVAGWFVVQDMPKIVHIAELSALQAFGAAGTLVYGLALKLAILLLIMALIDYSFQRWQHEQDLMMSKQDVKEEMKRMEGDPQIKQRRTRVAKQLAMQRVAQAVPQADVIVTNPTHFSIALQYDSDSMRAPRVIAKGADFMAMRIRQIAVAHGIPLVERKPLAQALYKSVEIGEEVPAEHYAAIAEILAYVYRLNGKKTA